MASQVAIASDAVVRRGGPPALVTATPPVARIRGVTLTYGKTIALDGVTLDIPEGRMVGVMGPDGVGKSSLLGLISGARSLQSGQIEVLGGDMRSAAHRRSVCHRIAYMPQGLGKNLYQDLTVFENLDFFGRLFDQAEPERSARIAILLEATGLAPFPDRQAGKLSGGMKQKLGLCCALIHDPDLLILDEPTTGVDPLSRRQFWELIERIRTAATGPNRPAMSVIVSTAYMDEAERFDYLIAMDEGRVLTTGSPHAIKAQTKCPDLNEAFIALLPEARRREHHDLVIPPLALTGGAPAIEATDLTCRFGDFTAVDRVSFRIERGEIFGFLGSNGCGKTTTMKVLTGLLPASKGQALLFGKAITSGDLETRRRVGYMSQSFSLYTELTVEQNLHLHAQLFHLEPGRLQTRIQKLIASFDLATVRDQLALSLPLGVRQRLSLAVAVLHEPEILILDEPTSGVDPIARDRFWALLIDLSRRQGVTIFISTHFMSEAERCDRVSLMHAGRVLASGAPHELIQARRATSLDEAFISCIEAAISGDDTDNSRTGAATSEVKPFTLAGAAWSRSSSFSTRRMLAYTWRETLELSRDRIRLTFAFGGTAFLMLIMGYGLSLDVNKVRYAVLDQDQSLQSRTYLEAFTGSRYFTELSPILSSQDRDRRLANNNISLALEIPSGFGRDIAAGRTAEVGAWIDGAMPFQAETTHGYVTGVHANQLARLQEELTGKAAGGSAARVETRYRYNQAFKSIYAMVPGVIALLLIMIPAILTALAVVREKELGSITNLYVTPVTRLEFMLGKQLPYIAIAMANFLLMVTLALLVFGVPFKGSFLALAAGALVYVTATTSIGFLMSSFTRSQVAALFGTAMATMIPSIQFSGYLIPTAALEGQAWYIGQVLPAAHFMKISVGTFTKALGFADIGPFLASLALAIPVLMALSLILLRKQER